jgi:hypothetical protein
MSTTKLMKGTQRDNIQLQWRPPQTYNTTLTHNLFNVVNGPINILMLGGMVRAFTGAVTARFIVAGVNAEAALVAINGGIGWIFVSTLNVAGTLVNALGFSLTDALLNSRNGMICGAAYGATSIIQMQLVGGTSVNCEIFMEYEKLSPWSHVTNA